MPDYSKILISVAKRFEPELLSARRAAAAAVGSTVGYAAVNKVKSILTERGIPHEVHSHESHVAPGHVYSDHGAA